MVGRQRRRQTTVPDQRKVSFGLNIYPRTVIPSYTSAIMS